ncbi:MAG: hypothetical protein KFB95_03025 [Simkaniaceae bacterium]|nr:MAG: hypothetical protein KFB95_03025 [Simkaniaceae bacterium]
MDGVHFGPKVNANLFRRQISPLQSYAQTKISDNPLTSLYHQASKFVHTCTVMAGSVADTLNSAGKSIQETASSMSGEALSSAASFGSRMQNTVADSAQEIWDIIFSVKESTVSPKHAYVDPNKIETKSWTDDTTTFNIALIGKIDPKSKGAFRVGGAKTEVLQRVDTQNIDHGVLSEASRKSATPPNSETITEAASSTLKESLRQRPLYDRGEAMQKTNHLINEEGEFVGTPEETYKALTSSLSPEKKQVFDQLLGLFSEVVANKEINSMPLSNLAIAFGPTLFPEGSSEGLSMMDGIAFAAENTKRQTALFGKLVEYAESQNAADQVEETPAEVSSEAAEATPEAGRVFADEGLNTISTK